MKKLETKKFFVRGNRADMANAVTIKAVPNNNFIIVNVYRDGKEKVTILDPASAVNFLVPNGVDAALFHAAMDKAIALCS